MVQKKLMVVSWMICNSLSLSTEGESITLVYVDSTKGWRVNTRWVNDADVTQEQCLILYCNRWNNTQLFVPILKFIHLQDLELLLYQ